jgi:hypothetical protein
MHTVSSFRGSVVSGEELSAIVADHIALERVRLFRRALVPRCGGLVILAIVFDLTVHNLSAAARWAPLAVFATPPAWAWIVELRLKYRLTSKLDAVDESAKADRPIAGDPSHPAR